MLMAAQYGKTQTAMSHESEFTWQSKSRKVLTLKALMVEMVKIEPYWSTLRVATNYLMSPFHQQGDQRLCLSCPSPLSLSATQPTY